MQKKVCVAYEPGGSQQHEEPCNNSKPDVADLPVGKQVCNVIARIINPRDQSGSLTIVRHTKK